MPVDLQPDDISLPPPPDEVEEDEQEPEEDPRDQPVYTFQFSYRERKGKGVLRVGTFVNHILTIEDMQKVGIYEAQLCNGLPRSSFSEEVLNLNMMIAHMSMSLKDRPEWAKQLSKVNDLGLLYALWQEVNGHEATFRGSEPDSA